MTPLSELRRAAEGASPGKWAAFNMVHKERGDQMTPEEIGEYVTNSVRKSQSRGDADRFLFITAHPGDGLDICLVGNGPLGPHNAHFIALANPSTILSLLDELEGARKALERISRVSEGQVWLPLAIAAREALREAVAPFKPAGSYERALKALADLDNALAPMTGENKPQKETP